jgi:hypothetical protein
MALLRVAGQQVPHPAFPTRDSAELQRGEGVERFINRNDKLPGYVLGAGVDGATYGLPFRVENLLVTTVMSHLGDLGAPVLDALGNVVAMICAGSDVYTFCIPIEDIRASFPDDVPT